MKRPAVFFDRDNTLIISDGYLGDPNAVVLIDGAAEAVARARQLGYATVVFTNQSGVARGLFSEEKVHAVNSRLDELLHDHSTHAVIDRHEYCPYHPDGSIEAYRKDSDLRKPKPGMILQAAERLALDLSRSWVIGDAPRDIEAGAAAGCRTILFTDPKLARSPAAKIRTKVEPDYVVDSLHAAMAIIEMQTRSEIPAILDTPSEPEPPAASVPPANLLPAASEPRPTAQTVVVPPANVPATAQQADSATAAIAETAIASPPAKAVSADMVPLASHASAAAAPKDDGAVEDSEDDGKDEDAGEDELVIERLESLLRQILDEIRRGREHQYSEFSVTKLLAGVAQILAVALLFGGWLIGKSADIGVFLLLAIFLQTLTISLLIMGRQR